MARVLITGSSDGLGLLAGRQLTRGGHEVVLHARNQARASATRAALPAASAVVVGDVSTLAGMAEVAGAARAAGPFDAVIHNVALGYRERRVETEDGLTSVFAVNVLAPYYLTAAIPLPRRLVYLTSGLHRSGDPKLDDLQWRRRRWDGLQAYADTKLWDAVLAAAIARRRPDVVSSSVEPGWVPTKMGGPSAPDDLELGAATQVWLATSDDPDALVSGRCLHHQAPQITHPAVRNVEIQEGLLAACAKLTGIELPSFEQPGATF
jgi:NAD(P)-dependent dehydrogenase (short-subunit alcohol dehydrogenase family)